MKLHPSNLKIRFLLLMNQLKALANADYSFSDFHPSKLFTWLQSIATRQHLDLEARLEGNSWRNYWVQFAANHQIKLMWFVIALAGIILVLVVIFPYAMRMEDQLSLRPAQWAYLQNLARESQLNLKGVELATQFDELELQRLRALLLSRGIKPSVLTVSAGAPIMVELQANGVLFSTLLELLDEMRGIWHLYPSDIDIQSTESAGVINVSSHFIQFQKSDTDVMNGAIIP